ncbi:hypothetical protein O181_060164 [Austropuccinia psidii MF-1]|uniref:NADP-dependent oxidoreductase domain-containing protein n=1 Tax=Austropuccinia psidii MF-1 TaxID=1389203 RepID=A0A9Q3HZC4_9BASI|nr:hypothetical protein [Austropuccinia psidii MF-1]
MASLNQATPDGRTRIPLILGAMTFGKPNTHGARIHDLPTVQKIIDTFKAHGHTEIDTARLYGHGSSEEMLSQVDLSGTTIDSKCYPINPGDHSPQKLRESLELSLQTLKLKKLRIFYLHSPDRSIPFEETLKGCHELFQEGKFEQLGLSNYQAWEVARIWEICDKNQFVKPTVYQAMYNSIVRSIEDELFPCCRALGIRIVIFNPLAGGFFAGKIKKVDDFVEKGGRFDPNHYQGKFYRERYLKDSYFRALESLTDVLKSYPEYDLLSIASIWLQHHSKLQPSDGIIFGGSSHDQIEMNLKNFEKGPLPDEIVKSLDSAWQLVKAECPPYWR